MICIYSDSRLCNVKCVFIRQNRVFIDIIQVDEIFNFLLSKISPTISKRQSFFNCVADYTYFCTDYGGCIALQAAIGGVYHCITFKAAIDIFSRPKAQETN